MIFNMTAPGGGGSVTGWTDISDSIEYVSDWGEPSHTVTDKLALLNGTTVVISMAISDPEGVKGSVTVGNYPPVQPEYTMAFYALSDGSQSGGDSFDGYDCFHIDTYGETYALMFVAYETA